MPPRPTADEGAGSEQRDVAALASAPPVACAPSPRASSDAMLDPEEAAPAGEELSSRIDRAHLAWPEQAEQVQQVQGAERAEREAWGGDAMALSSLFCQIQFNYEDMAQRPVDVVVANVSLLPNGAAHGACSAPSSAAAAGPHGSAPANSTSSSTAPWRPTHAAPMGAGIWLENTMPGLHTCRSPPALYHARLAPNWHATLACCQNRRLDLVVCVKVHASGLLRACTGDDCEQSASSGARCR